MGISKNESPPIKVDLDEIPEPVLIECREALGLNEKSPNIKKLTLRAEKYLSAELMDTTRLDEQTIGQALVDKLLSTVPKELLQESVESGGTSIDVEWG